MESVVQAKAALGNQSIEKGLGWLIKCEDFKAIAMLIQQVLYFLFILRFNIPIGFILL
jgi:hypothetical protein